MLSNPVGIACPSQVTPAGAGVLYERTSRSGLSLFFPQMTMSPWFPLQGWKSTSFGRDGNLMSMIRNPSYVPWNA
jgi:hypothetical protein